MRKLILSLFIIVLMAMPVIAQDAMVQIIHNAADIDVRSVDVYANDGLLLDNFEFRKATAFTALPAGTYTIVIAPDNSANAQDSVITQFDLTLEAGAKYVAIVNGISEMNLAKYQNPDPDNRNIQLSPFVVGNAQEAAVDPAKVEFMVFHGSTDAPAVDVMVGGNVLIDNADYGMNTPYLAVDPAQYQLDITPAEDNATIVASFDADLSGLAGGAAVVFASGFLTPDANEGGKAFGLFAALPDGQVVEFPIIIVLPAGPWTNLGVNSEWAFDAVFDSTVNQTHGIAV
ncbi:DUF4397 domain-containing protein, partial [candidate division KSB1 bacterium]|nr:DUF4397 domain-containing protein [candidate division KSB1 bacterium]